MDPKLKALKSINIEQLEREAPDIVNYYKNQVLLSIKSKGIKKETAKKEGTATGKKKTAKKKGKTNS